MTRRIAVNLAEQSIVDRLDMVLQRELVAEVAEVVEASPLTRPVARGGQPMRVRVTSAGRVVTPAVTVKHGLTGVSLDPPYCHTLRSSRLYREDSATLSGEVRAWALEHGTDPLLRISSGSARELLLALSRAPELEATEVADLIMVE